MHIAVVGTFQVGKSTLVNCLTDPFLANVGVGLSTTHTVNFYQTVENDSFAEIVCRNREGRPLVHVVGRATVDFCVPDGTTRIDVRYKRPSGCMGPDAIIDTPGFDATGHDASNDTRLTREIIVGGSTDLIVLVVPNTQIDSSLRHSVIPHLLESRKEVVALMNCVRGNPDPDHEQNLSVAQQIAGELSGVGVRLRRASPVHGQLVLPCNVAWGWVARCTAGGRSMLNESMRQVFAVRAQNVINHFELLLGEALPSDELLWRRSNLEPLATFLSEATVRKALWQEDNPPISDIQMRNLINRKLSQARLIRK